MRAVSAAVALPSCLFLLLQCSSAQPQNPARRKGRLRGQTNSFKRGLQDENNQDNGGGLPPARMMAAKVGRVKNKRRKRRSTPRKSKIQSSSESPSASPSQTLQPSLISTATSSPTPTSTTSTGGGGGEDPDRTWTVETKLIAGDGFPQDFFGATVSISENTAIVGAPRGGSSGSASIFERGGSAGGGAVSWSEETKLVPSDGAAVDLFGSAVSINGDTVIVGAQYDDDNGRDSGSAYIFTRSPGSSTTWTEQAKVTASDAATDDRFGVSVSITEDTSIVGAFRDDDNGFSSGSAYIFVRESGATTWTEQAKLTASDGASGDEFGFSVSISGDTAIVGAYLDDDNGSASGSAYIFVRDSPGATTWSEQAKLTAQDGSAGDWFGASISIQGDTAIVGAPFSDHNGISGGGAYILVRESGTTTWTEQAKLTASDASANDQFGNSVSISGDSAIVGAYRDATLSGSAYAFTRNPGGTMWTEQVKLTASDAEIQLRFGFSVSIGEDGTVLVGSMEPDEPGTAYVFE